MVNRYLTPPKLDELNFKLGQLLELFSGKNGNGNGPISPLEYIIRIIKEIAPETLGTSAIIPFQKTISAATMDYQERSVNFQGIIKKVLMAFPAGCHQLVEVRLVYMPKEGGEEPVIPSIKDSFIALDDAPVVPFEPGTLVTPATKMRVDWFNYDELNEHTVPVIVMLSRTQLKEA